jgi:hypothetical protein
MPHFKDAENKLYWLDAGDDPAIWLPQCTPITDEEAEALRPKPQELTYAQKRVLEYPPIGDQLDALFHAGVFPVEMAALVQAVKDKYPKV